MDEGNVVNSFSIHAKRHIDKAMKNWCLTTNLATTVAELSDRVKDVTIASKQGSCAHAETSQPRCSRTWSRSRDSRCLEHCRPYSPDVSDGNAHIEFQNSSPRLSCKSYAEELHPLRSKSRSHSRHMNRSSRRWSTELSKPSDIVYPNTYQI